MVILYKCRPNQALVVTGGCRNRRPPRVSLAGRVFVWPLIETVSRISLSPIVVTIETAPTYTQQAIPVTVRVTALIKVDIIDGIGGSDGQHLLGGSKSADEIRQLVSEILDAHVRSAVGGHSVEDLCFRRHQFGESVRQRVAPDFKQLGFTVQSLMVTDIGDDNNVGYIRSLGEPVIARVKCEARLADSRAKLQAISAEAVQREQCARDYYTRLTNVIQVHREFELRKAECEAKLMARRAMVDSVYRLVRAKRQQRVVAEEWESKLIEKDMEIKLWQRELSRKQWELESTVRKQAEADKLLTETMAASRSNAIIRVAEATASALQVLTDAHNRRSAAMANTVTTTSTTTGATKQLVVHKTIYSTIIRWLSMMVCLLSTIFMSNFFSATICLLTATVPMNTNTVDSTVMSKQYTTGTTTTTTSAT
ncbi:flotillin-1-like [Oppia nitens]|uniref:flotillin-1-like n=1 Tax=Oppia nitens TaxID=1686743 RepID=UPI0023D9EF7E|nr:flotillin-1-like [Oppia nitens]